MPETKQLESHLHSALLLLVATLLLNIVAIGPATPQSALPVAFAAGLAFGQASLAGLWMALAARFRLPLSLFAVLVSAVPMAARTAGDYKSACLLLSVQALATAGVCRFVGLSGVDRWAVWNNVRGTAEQGRAATRFDARPPQFSLRQILLLTTFVAVLLVLFRQRQNIAPAQLHMALLIGSNGSIAVGLACCLAPHRAPPKARIVLGGAVIGLAISAAILLRCTPGGAALAAPCVCATLFLGSWLAAARALGLPVRGAPREESWVRSASPTRGDENRMIHSEARHLQPCGETSQAGGCSSNGTLVLIAQRSYD